MNKIDKSLMLTTTLLVASIVILITLFNKEFVIGVNYINYILTHKLGFYYIIIGVASILVVLIVAFSKYGKIKLGETKEYSDFSWASMIFTSTMAADIIFFSLHEWIYYYNNYKDSYLASQSPQLASHTYTLFHWGFIPWSFYMVPAVAYAYIMYNKKRNCNRLSDACYPLIKSKVILKIIDIVGVVGLMVAVSTTFSLATPLLSEAITRLLNIPNNNTIVVSIIVLIGVIYSIDVLSGLNGISKVARFSTHIFLLFLGLVLISTDPVSVINNSMSSLGNLIQNHIGMSTYTSKGSFTFDYTIFYWAYWIAWSVATPFFIATISKGRTIREVLTKGLCYGVGGTFLSFMILGNYTYNYELANSFKELASVGSVSMQHIIVDIISHTPNSTIILIVMSILMIMLYVTTLNSIIYTISNYSYNKLKGESSSKVKIYWSLLFLIIPVSLVYLSSTMETLKTLSIILAMPISIITIIVTVNFIKSLRSNK